MYILHIHAHSLRQSIDYVSPRNKQEIYNSIIIHGTHRPESQYDRRNGRRLRHPHKGEVDRVGSRNADGITDHRGTHSERNDVSLIKVVHASERVRTASRDARSTNRRRGGTELLDPVHIHTKVEQRIRRGVRDKDAVVVPSRRRYGQRTARCPSPIIERRGTEGTGGR